MNNKIVLKFYSNSENEGLARSCISSLMLPFNPSISQLSDVKTAVSEAVTNAIVHGYPDGVGIVTLEAEIDEDELHIKISDDGVGIENTERAVEPFFTTGAENERSGMGFTIMKTFMDGFDLKSSPNQGTTVLLSKKLKVAK